MHFDQIKKILSHHGYVADEIIPIPTGKFNYSCKIYLKEPVRIGNSLHEVLVLRIAPSDSSGQLFYEKNMIRQEPEIHDQVKEKTSIPIAEILAYNFSRNIIDRDYMLLEFLQGVPLSDKNIDKASYDQVLYDTAKYLKELHTMIQADSYGYLGDHNCMAPGDSWHDAFQTMWGKLVKDIRDCGVFIKTEAGFAEKTLSRHIDKFVYDKPASLLHMDIWSQNILIGEDNRITGILDWDRALWGDPEIEFAVLDYVGFDQSSFWEGYGDSEERRNGYEIRKQFYLLYEIQKYLVIWTQRRKGMANQVNQYKAYAMNALRRLQ